METAGTSEGRVDLDICPNDEKEDVAINEDDDTTRR
tara:strand:- start:29 stop:136 length:108 start_codon:yes stop_codon:yes gene_type:complete